MKKFFKSLGKKSDKSPKGPPPEGSPKLGATARPSASTSSLVGYDVKEKELGKLHKAAWLNDVSKVRQLAKKDPSCFDKENRTPLHLACARGHAEVVEVLLEWKAKTNIADNNSKSPLMKAVEAGHTDCVSQLLDSRADVDAADRDGNTCLHMACNFNDADIAKLLNRAIRNKEKLNAKNKEGLPPLHYTIMHKNEELCRLLLREGADVNIEDTSGRTCLMKACQDGSINLVKILLEFEADTTHKDTKGWTADDCAVIQGHHACSQLIADHLLRQNLANRTPASTPRSSLPPSLAATPRDKSLEIGAPAMDIAGHDSDEETVSKGSEVGAKGGGYDDSWGDDTDLSMAGDDRKAKVVGPKVNLAKFIPDSDEGDSSRASKMARVEEDEEDEDDPQKSPLKKRNSTKSLQSNTSWEEDSSWSVQEPKRSSTRVSFKEDKNLSQIHNLSGPESEESFDGKPAKDKSAPSKTDSYVPTGMSGTPAVSTISADKQRAPGNKNAFLEELGISDPDDLSDADVSELSGADPKKAAVAVATKTDEDSDWDSTAMSDPMSTPRPGILKNWKKQSNVEEEDEDEDEEHNKGDHPVGKQNSTDEVDPSSEWDSTTADPAIREDKPPPLPMSPVPEKDNIREYDSDIEEGILPDHQPVSHKVEAMVRQRQLDSQDTDEELGDDFFEDDEVEDDSPFIERNGDADLTSESGIADIDKGNDTKEEIAVFTNHVHLNNTERWSDSDSEMTDEEYGFWGMNGSYDVQGLTDIQEQNKSKQRAKKSVSWDTDLILNLEPDDAEDQPENQPEDAGDPGHSSLSPRSPHLQNGLLSTLQEVQMEVVETKVSKSAVHAVNGVSPDLHNGYHEVEEALVFDLPNGGLGLPNGGVGLSSGGLDLPNGVVGLSNGGLGLLNGDVGLSSSGVDLTNGSFGQSNGDVGLSNGVELQNGHADLPNDDLANDTQGAETEVIALDSFSDEDVSQNGYVPTEKGLERDVMPITLPRTNGIKNELVPLDSFSDDDLSDNEVMPLDLPKSNGIKTEILPLQMHQNDDVADVTDVMDLDLDLEEEDSSMQLVVPHQAAHDNSNQESDWDSTVGMVTPRQTGGLGYKEFRPGAEDDDLSDPAYEDEEDGGRPLQPVRDQVLMAVTHIAGVNPATPTPRNAEEDQEGGSGEKQEGEDEEDSEWDSDTDLLPSENGPAPVAAAKLNPAQKVSHHSRSADSDSDQGTETISEWEIERKKQKESIKVGGSLIDFEDMTDLTQRGQENTKQLEMEEERKKEEEELRRKEEERKAEEKRFQEEEMRERERKLKEEAEAEERRKEEERQREEEMREEERKREEEERQKEWERQEQERQDQLKREAEAAREEEEQERQREWERQEQKRQEQMKREADAALEEERQAAADISSGGDSLPDVDVHAGQKDDEDEFELSEKEIPLMVEKTEPSLVQGTAPSILMSEFDGSEEELKRVEAEVQQDNLLGQKTSAQNNVFKSSSLSANGQPAAAKAQVQPIVRQQAVYAPPLSLPPTKSTSQTLKQRLQVPPLSQMALQNRMEDFDDEDSYASDNGNPDSPRATERPDVTSYYPNLLGSSGGPSYNFSQVLDDDALSYTSTEFETESVVGKSMENSPFARDMLLSLNMNDPTTLVKLQEHYRDQRRQLEQEKNHKHMLENKLKLLNAERSEFTKKVEGLTEHKISLEQNKLDLEATIRGLEYKITEEEEKRRNAEVLLEKTKDQLNRKEEKYTSSVEDKQKAELERRNMVMELRAINNRVKELEGEREELERQLDHERETRLLQEKINEEQNKLHEQLQNEKVKAVKQLMEKRSTSQAGEDDADGVEIDSTLKAELIALQTELDRQRSRAKDENALIVAENEDLHAKVEELKTEIKLREDALNVATMQYSVQIGSMQTENNQLSSELERERAVLEKLEAELESQKNRLQSTMSEMEKGLQARHDLERELQLSHEELRKETEKKDAEMDKSRETITELTEKLHAAEMKMNSMEKELNMTNTSLLERTNQLKQINHNIDGLKTSLDNMDQNYKLEKDHNSKLLTKIETMQDKLAAAQHESLSLKQQLETTRQAAIQDASISAQEKFNSIIAGMKTDHEKSVGALQERNTSLQESVTRLKEEMRNTENRRSTLEMDMRHHSQEQNDLIKKLSHAEASLELAQRLKDQQEQERTQLKLEVERLQQKYQTAHEKSVESQARVSELVERMERAEQSSLASSQQLLHTSANIQAFSKSKDEVEGNMQRLLIDNTRLEAELKHEKQRAEMLHHDLADSQKVRSSLEALCSNLKSTNAHLEDKLGPSDGVVDTSFKEDDEETANRTVLQQEAEDSKGLWEQEVVSRSKLGLRIAQLDRQKQEAVGSVDEEKRKARKAVEGKKMLENKLEAEREKSLQLQKEITTLKVHLKNTKKKMKEPGFSDCVVNLNSEFDKERCEMEEALTVTRNQLSGLRRELEEEVEEKERLLASNMALQEEVEKLRTIGASLGKISRRKLRLEGQMGTGKSGDSSTGGGGGGGSPQDLDSLRAELEAKYRLELNRKLEEVNRYLEDQARARDRLDMSRGENESRLSIDKKKLEDENMDLKLKYEKARAACETREMETRRFRELYDSEMKWRMRLSDQLERATSRAGDYKSKLVSEKQRSKFITSVNNLNLSAISNGLDASRLSSTVDDPLSNKLRAELDRSIAKHLEAAPHDDSVPVIRSPDKSALLESSFAKSSAEYYDLLKRKYCI